MPRFTLATLLLWLAFGCSPEGVDEDSKRSGKAVESTSGDSTGSDQDGPEAPESGDDEFKEQSPPANVAGINLTSECTAQTSDQDLGRYVFACFVKDQAKQKVDLIQVIGADKFGWEVGLDDTSLALDYQIAVGDNQKTPAAIFTFGATNYTKAVELLTASLDFHYTDPNTLKETNLSTRVAGIMAALRNQLKFRLVINSISNHDPGQPIQYMDRMELKIDGVWLELVLDPMTYELRLNGKALQSNGNLSDKDPFIFLNVTHRMSPTLVSAAFTRFNATAPYDLAPGKDPLYLQLDFETPTSITGFRYNGGQLITNHNVAAGFPDLLHFETSKDGVAWTMVPGSLMDVQAGLSDDIAEFYWKGSDL